MLQHLKHAPPSSPTVANTARKIKREEAAAMEDY